MLNFEEKYDYQEIMVEDISQIYQIANDYNSFYDLPRSGRGDPGDERTYPCDVNRHLFNVEGW